MRVMNVKTCLSTALLHPNYYYYSITIVNDVLLSPPKKTSNCSLRKEGNETETFALMDDILRLLYYDISVGGYRGL